MEVKSFSNKCDVTCLSLIYSQLTMVYRMSHKWYLSHFVAQKVTLMTQLKIYIIKSYKKSCSCTNEVKKLFFMQKYPPGSFAVIFLTRNDICNVSLWYYFVRLWKTNNVNQQSIFWIVVINTLSVQWNKNKPFKQKWYYLFV